jgi:hypothetical protein
MTSAPSAAAAARRARVTREVKKRPPTDASHACANAPLAEGDRREAVAQAPVVRSVVAQAQLRQRDRTVERFRTADSRAAQTALVASLNLALDEP